MPRPVAKRNDIIRAALELFVEKGIEATTTREIAERARAGEGTMYRHFPSKEEMAWQIFKDHLDDFMTELETAIKDKDSAKDRLQAMISTFYQLFEKDPTVYTYLLLSEHQLARRMTDAHRTPVDLLIETIKYGQKRGEIRRQDPNLAAAFTFGIVLRVTLFKIYGRISGNIQNIVNEVLEGCWRSIA